MVNQRSKSGCWTCRLRRKKCPEDGMPCSSCDARGVVCHGYGPRPAWKDRGDREREEVDRLQLRRRSHPRWLSHLSQQHTNHPLAQHAEQQRCSHIQEGSSDGCGGSGGGGGGGGGATGARGACLSSSLALAPLPDIALPPSPPQLSEEQDHEPPDFPITLDLESDLPALTAPSAVLPDFWVDDMDGLLGATPTLLGTSDATFDSQVDMSAGGAPAEEHDHSVMRTFASSSARASTSQEREIELMMQFLGEDFNKLYPCYRSSSIADGAWLMCLLQRSSAFFYAALSTSAYFNFLKAPLHDGRRTELFREYDQFRSKAMESYCELLEANCDGSHQDVESATKETLVCSVQLAVLESLSENVDATLTYLRSASQALAKVSQESICINGLAPMQQGLFPAASAMVRRAVAVFTCILIWMDVLHCSSRQTRPTASSLYRLTLSSTLLGETFGRVVGFDGWVLVAHMDAIDTAVWKQEQELQNRLSMRELVAKSETILSTIEHQIQQTQDAQTLINAHAVVIYIHTIISGCRPAVPEIQETLEKSVPLWQKLSFCHGELRPMSWAFCVLASLAMGQHRTVFVDILSEAATADPSSTTVACLQSLAEECWKILDAGSADCNWEMVMRSLQRNLDKIFS